MTRAAATTLFGNMEEAKLGFAPFRQQSLFSGEHFFLTSSRQTQFARIDEIANPILVIFAIQTSLTPCGKSALKPTQIPITFYVSISLAYHLTPTESPQPLLYIKQASALMTLHNDYGGNGNQLPFTFVKAHMTSEPTLLVPSLAPIATFVNNLFHSPHAYLWSSFVIIQF
jgi:hypothetical protein